MTLLSFETASKTNFWTNRCSKYCLKDQFLLETSLKLLENQFSNWSLLKTDLMTSFWTHFCGFLFETTNFRAVCYSKLLWGPILVSIVVRNQLKQQFLNWSLFETANLVIFEFIVVQKQNWPIDQILNRSWFETAMKTNFLPIFVRKYLKDQFLS